MQARVTTLLNALLGAQTVIALYQYEDADPAEGFKALCEILCDTALIRAQQALEIMFPSPEPRIGLCVLPSPGPLPAKHGDGHAATANS